MELPQMLNMNHGSQLRGILSSTLRAAIDAGCGLRDGGAQALGWRRGLRAELRARRMCGNILRV
ncbi:hypothetical protein E2562_010235 [Oryza meyeriana var. granulata]|uniref:Uncharacterized protein n=1 Tax=Oryza meyeriana var. granulata TaxID=110450 RepID=A0A6G1EJP9_9ORYZ|nr:hypothetical protein E2562_010235 [Oryza meyeriana var. granulata]